LLVVAGEAAARAEEIPFGVRELLDAADDIFVLTPSLPTRFEWLASATDAAREKADQRLAAVLGQLGELGREAHGAVGSDDPVEGIADAVREFEPDHLLIALRPGQAAGWQERGLLDEIQHRLSIPMTVFSV
jgi:hypothetical protein